MQAAPPEMRKALMMALHTGQRQGDILRMSWSNYDRQYISIRQSKNGARVEIPFTEALKVEPDSWNRDAAVILTTQTGLPVKKRCFDRLWAEVCEAAEIESLHYHDLRGTAEFPNYLQTAK